jgi:hypothetical protein
VTALLVVIEEVMRKKNIVDLPFFDANTPLCDPVNRPIVAPIVSILVLSVVLYRLFLKNTLILFRLVTVPKNAFTGVVV